MKKKTENKRKVILEMEKIKKRTKRGEKKIKIIKKSQIAI